MYQLLTAGGKMMMKTMMTRPTRDPRSLHLRTVDTSSPGQNISRYHLIMSSSVEINSFFMIMSYI